MSSLVPSSPESCSTDKAAEAQARSEGFRGTCRYKSGKCANERALKRNGQPHTLCDYHRIRQNAHQRKSDRKNREIHFAKRVLKRGVNCITAKTIEAVCQQRNLNFKIENRRFTPMAHHQARPPQREFPQAIPTMVSMGAQQRVRLPSIHHLAQMARVSLARSNNQDPAVNTRNHMPRTQLPANFSVRAQRRDSYCAPVITTRPFSMQQICN